MQLRILDSVSGVLKPGRLTLLLGPPASGKSTLLKALSGRLEHTSLKVRCLLAHPGHHVAIRTLQRWHCVIQHEHEHLTLLLRPTLHSSGMPSCRSILLKAMSCRLEHTKLKVRALLALVCSAHVTMSGCASSVDIIRQMSPSLQHHGPQVGGSVTYNGHPFKDFRVQRTATYIEQVRAGLRMHKYSGHVASRWPCTALIRSEHPCSCTEEPHFCVTGGCAHGGADCERDI